MGYPLGSQKIGVMTSGPVDAVIIMSPFSQGAKEQVDPWKSSGGVPLYGGVPGGLWPLPLATLQPVGPAAITMPPTRSLLPAWTSCGPEMQCDAVDAVRADGVAFAAIGVTRASRVPAARISA